MLYRIGLVCSLALCACTPSPSALDGSTAKANVTGTVSAGPINGATVTAYALNSDGTQGSQLGVSTSDSRGHYSLNMTSTSGSVVLVVTGGSYTEEASGSTVSMGNAQLRTALPTIADGQQIGVTPVTEIATQNALATIAANSNVSLTAIINSSNAKVATAMGLADITIPPADPTLSANSATSSGAAKYAVVLASISQMANSAAVSNNVLINSLDMMQALATSFTYNGSFNSKIGATDIPVPNGAGSNISLNSVLGGTTSFNSAMQTATNTIIATMPSGFNDTSVVPAITYVTAPPAPSDAPAVNLPPPPTILPSTEPSVGGPPPVPTPSPAPVSTPTPTPTAAPTSTPTPTSPPAASSHLFIADTNGGDHVCNLNPSTGLIGTCTSGGGNWYSSFDYDAVIKTTTTASLYIAAGYEVSYCPFNPATGVMSCFNNGSSIPDSYGRRVKVLTIPSSGASFAYLVSIYSGVRVCPISSSTGYVGTCVDSNSGLTTPQMGQSSSSAGWGPKTIDFFTTTGGTTYAYVLEDHASGSIFRCSVDSMTGLLSSCAAIPSSGMPSSYGGDVMKIKIKTWGSNTYVYMALPNDIYKCTLDASTGNLSACGATNGGITSGAWYPASVDFSNLGGATTYAYISDQNNSTIYVCTVNTTTGVLASCTQSAANGLSQPWSAMVF